MLSTYRLRGRPDFDPDATADFSGYVAELGGSHLYNKVVHPTRGSGLVTYPVALPVWEGAAA